MGLLPTKGDGDRRADPWSAADAPSAYCGRVQCDFNSCAKGDPRGRGVRPTNGINHFPVLTLGVNDGWSIFDTSGNQLAHGSNAKMKTATDALNATQQQLEKAKAAAQPRDIADIIVCEPFTIRVKPVEKK